MSYYTQCENPTHTYRHKHTHRHTHTPQDPLSGSLKGHINESWVVLWVESNRKEHNSPIRAKTANLLSRGDLKKNNHLHNLRFKVHYGWLFQILVLPGASNPSDPGNKSSTIYGTPCTKHLPGTCWGAVMLTETLADMLVRAANRRRGECTKLLSASKNWVRKKQNGVKRED